MSAIVVTGAAGFVGAAVCDRLLARGEAVVGLDNFNAYYDVGLKEARADRLAGKPGFSMVRGDLSDADMVRDLIAGARHVVHVGAQAGVRHSIEAPFDYERSNLAGHLSVLEACRAAGVDHLVYASSSSVYGERPETGAAFKETDAAAKPASLYAATKRANELMSEAYASLYRIPQTGLRFFTVYGPWGRPDMAYFSFTRKILAGEPIEVYGQGNMARDFTYIDDIVDGIIGSLDHPPPAGENRILNIGAGRPVGLMEMISILEKALGREASKIFRPMQPGDVTRTSADISALAALTGYAPKVTLEEGLERFVAWYRTYYAA
ncbi:MAG: NAD-dependent epimerase/dehydratase family protein [Alphaproteobacteria bacterium]